MASSVNRHRRQHAFTRGFDRPQGSNPYANPVLAALWMRGREKRLAASGGVMPLPPRPSDKPRPIKKSPPPPGRGRPGSSGPGQHRGWR